MVHCLLHVLLMLLKIVSHKSQFLLSSEATWRSNTFEILAIKPALASNSLRTSGTVEERLIALASLFQLGFDRPWLASRQRQVAFTLQPTDSFTIVQHKALLYLSLSSGSGREAGQVWGWEGLDRLVQG